MENISSRKNPYIMRLRALANDSELRRKEGEYLCDGHKLLYEAIDKGCVITSVLWKEEAKPLPGLEKAKQYIATAELFDYASPMKNSPGPIFTLSMPENPDVDFDKAILLENVQDPGNVGTVIRTANALGMDAVILTGNCADVFGAKTARAAMGALFRQTVLTMQQSEAVAWLHEQGLRVYGAALSDRAVDVRTVSLGDAAFVIGSEGQGLSEEMLSLCDGEVIIPMEPGSESLNAGVAAAILMWELAR